MAFLSVLVFFFVFFFVFFVHVSCFYVSSWGFGSAPRSGSLPPGPRKMRRGSGLAGGGTVGFSGQLDRPRFFFFKLGKDEENLQKLVGFCRVLGLEDFVGRLRDVKSVRCGCLGQGK